MTDFTDIISADLLPEAVRSYISGHAVIETDTVWRDEADAAIVAALELAASLMVCATCRRCWQRYDELVCTLGASVGMSQSCEFTPSRWQHYWDGE